MDQKREGIEEQTGTGAPRSSDGTVRSPSVSGDDAPDGTMNRSGSGGTGGPDTPDEAEGSTSESMDEMLGE